MAAQLDKLTRRDRKVNYFYGHKVVASFFEYGEDKEVLYVTVFPDYIRWIRIYKKEK